MNKIKQNTRSVYISQRQDPWATVAFQGCGISASSELKAHSCQEVWMPLRQCTATGRGLQEPGEV